MIKTDNNWKISLINYKLLCYKIDWNIIFGLKTIQVFEIERDYLILLVVINQYILLDILFNQKSKPGVYFEVVVRSLY